MNRHRLWLCLPPITLFIVDMTLTLYGQPDAYWAGKYSHALEGSPDLPYVVVGLWTDMPLPPDFELASWTQVMGRWDAQRATDPDAPELLDLVLVNPTGYTKFERGLRF